jgi:signal transduction histidine kinase
LTRLAQVVMEQTELRLSNLNLLQQRDEFIDIAAHEMRTPLTTLKVSMQMLKAKLSDSEHKVADRMIEQANRGVNKLTRLVNDLFDVSRLNERNLVFDKTVFPIGQLVENCCEYATIMGGYKLEVTGNRDLQTVGDQAKLEQVLINLIDNAVKYAPKSKTIYIDFKEESGFVRVTVTDKGPGIAADKLPHLFRRYFRSDPNSVQSGLGLGLYIAAEIVKHHGGDIGVESQPGEGASFWFTLPLLQK